MDHGRGPYRAGSSNPSIWAKNLERLNTAAAELFERGHVPVVGVNMALAVIERSGPESYERIMRPLSLQLAKRCDAMLRLDGPSPGADAEVQSFRRRGLPVFQSLDDIPSASRTDRPRSLE